VSNRFHVLGLFWLLAALSPARVRAQAPSDVTPPVLTESVRAELPEGTAPTEPVTVLLELEIDPNGKVMACRTVSDAPDPLIRAAEAAARRFRFEPAKRAGVPIAARIRYAYRFEPEARATEPPAAERPAEPTHAPEPRVEPAPARAAGSSPEESFEATAEVEAPPRELTRRTIARDELQKVPGTSGDALRAIEVMPGVARTSVDAGDPILRGAAYNESRSFIEGDTVPLLYHFGGVKSAFNSELLERVDLYPGNFSSRFGRATGGILDVRVRDPRRDRLHSLVDLSVLDSMAVVEAPIGERVAVAVGARRSNIDFFYDMFVPKNAFRVLAAPTYWDYQAIATYQAGKRHALRLLAHGSRDSLKLFFSQPSALDPGLRGSVGAAIEYHRVQAALQSRLGPDVTQRIQATFGGFNGNQTFGDTGSRFNVYELFGRAEWNIAAAPGARVNAGLDFQGQFLAGRYEGMQAPQNDGSPDYYDSSSATFDTKRVKGDLTMLRPAAYLEVEWHPTKELRLVPGIRADYDGFARGWTVDPRVVARYQVLEDTAIKWGAGLYSQSPEYYQSIRGFGNPDLKPYHALHLGGGVEQRFGEELRLGCEGFYKRLIERPVMTPGGAPPIYENDGIGRIYGAELSARLRAGRTTGYFAYTLSRSERRDQNRAWRLFDKDQTHILAVTASQNLGRGWLVGARFRLVSGNPYTPVIGAVYDAGVDAYRPVHGPVNSARQPLFHQLDLRVEKKWLLGPGSLTAYLDLQNAYNAQHVEATSYSFDYRRQERVYGMPLVPNLGLRGEL
jgi:TonB family protein